MTKSEIFKLLKANALVTVPQINEKEVTEQASLKELGANSIDRAEIIMMTMQDMDIRAAMMDFAKAKNMGELCELLEMKSH